MGSQVILRRISGGWKVKMWRRLLSATPATSSPPPPLRIRVSCLLSSLLCSFQSSRIGEALRGDDGRPGYIFYGAVDDDFGSNEPDFTFSKSDLQSDEAVWGLYQRWCLHYDIDRSRREMEWRFPTFKNNALKAYEMNNLQLSSVCALNGFADRMLREGSFFDEEVPPWKLKNSEAARMKEHNSKKY